jgi:hypothetical protein
VHFPTLDTIGGASGYACEIPYVEVVDHLREKIAIPVQFLGVDDL